MKRYLGLLLCLLIGPLVLAGSASTDRISGTLSATSVKAPCVTVATSPITLAGLQTIGGVALAQGDRVLVTAQPSAVDNGIYLADSGDWQRAADFNGPRDVVNGTLIVVPIAGGLGAFYQTLSTNPVIPGTSPVTFVARDNPNVTYPVIVGESGVTNAAYPYGSPRRFGAKGDCSVNDTVAVQAAITASGVTGKYEGWPGDNYCVTSVTFPASGGPAVVYFNGSELTGIATTATPAIVQIKSNFTFFADEFLVNGGSYLGIAPNSNYVTAIWWFNGHIASGVNGITDGASQFDTFNGMRIIGAVRGLVYGQLPGSNSSSTTVHSENRIYNFQSVGVSNPIYINSSTGFLHCYGCVFFRDAATWTTPTLPSTARAVETVVGNLFMHGGELIASNSTVGYAADLNSGFFEGVYIEASAPIQIMGGNTKFVGCRHQVLNQGVSAYKANGVAGITEFSGCTFFRPAGIGAVDRTAFFDGSAVPTHEVISNNNVFQEWGFLQNQANVKLIQGCSGRYYKTQYNLTAVDPNLYLLDDPRISIVPQNVLDDSGYTTTGWTRTDSGGSGTLSITTAAGPPGFLASQLQIANATGQSSVLSGDQTSLTTIKATMSRVSPNETYWESGWLNFTAGGTSAQLVVSFFDLTGAAVSTVVAANNTSIGSGGWVFVEGGIPVPATAAYAAEGVIVNTGTLKFVRIRLQRAWT